MMKLKIAYTNLFVLLASGLLSAGVAMSEPYPLEYFALREVTNNVEVSPDGKYVSMMKILSREGDPILHVYDASDLSKDPLVINSDPMEITGYDWVSDTDIVMQLRQKVRDKIEGYNRGVYEYKFALLDVKNEALKEFDEPSPFVENILTDEPSKIIISVQPGLDDTLGVTAAFRPRTYYKFDLKRGTKELLLKGKWELGQIDFDSEGNPQFARGFDRGSKEYVYYYRSKGDKSWNDFYRLSEDSFDDFNVYGVDEAIPGNVIVAAQNGNDKRGLWSYNVKSKSFDEMLYQRSDVDVYGVRFHSNTWTRPDSITAVSYFKDNFHFEYFDEIEGATFGQLEQLIPNSHYVSIPSRSRDGSTLVAMNRGPRDPGTYYLLKDGAFNAIGSRQPLLDPEELADVEYITYDARDGRKIPGFITVPNGKPPYPLVVLPHGGPHVNEVVLYDEWAQMLANNGYMVLQPQYRMSLGYGQEHFFSAWVDGSEGGRKMQDDKDDGAKYLVEEGLADPDRMAMFGWSYGGYAALIAASRTPQLYQCAIAGAAPSDPVRSRNETRGGSDRGATKFFLDKYRKESLSPMAEVEKVNIPLLVIHGDVDQRVRIYHAKNYVKALEKHGKPYKYVELEGADHFSNTLFYEHQIKLYESMIDFLQNDCGINTMQASAANN